MRLKLKRPLIIFDTETTGTDPKTDRIIELAVVKLGPDGSREEKCRRFNPLVPIPKDATAVHGITNEDVKDEPPFAKMAGGKQGIAAYFRGCDLGGYNIIGFDIPILLAELERAGETLELTDVAIIDAYRIFTSREPRDLTAALKFYCDKEMTNAHTALGDVLATSDVLAAQLDRYEDLPEDPDELDRSLRDPNWVDRQGKIRLVDGRMTISFGRNKGKALEELARDEPDYLRWMITNRVAHDARKVIENALMDAQGSGGAAVRGLD